MILTPLFRLSCLLGLGVWMGSGLLAFIVAPVFFRMLSRQQAGEMIGAVLLKYYGIGYVCGAMALLGIGGLLTTNEKGLWLLGVILLGSLVIHFYIDRILTPELKAIKSENSSSKRFQALHRRSVVLNSLILFLNLVNFSLFILYLDL